MTQVAFKAEYAGRCGECTEEIQRGDIVTYHDGAVVHETCAAPYSRKTLTAPTEPAEEEFEVEWAVRGETILPEGERVTTQPLRLVRPACPVCHLELPVSGVCGSCY